MRAKNPRSAINRPAWKLAAALYDLADKYRNRTDQDLAVAIAIGKVHVAQDSAALEAASRSLLELAPKNPRLLERTLVTVNNPAIAAQLCHNPSANIVWQCVRANPADLAEYLPAVAPLPSLVFTIHRVAAVARPAPRIAICCGSTRSA
jgi:hypothetical protein